MMPRTAALMVLHDTDDKRARESLGKLLLAVGKDVEIQWLDPTLAVAFIGPCALENSPEDKDAR
jgi:hypothetical protein